MRAAETPNIPPETRRKSIPGALFAHPCAHKVSGRTREIPAASAAIPLGPFSLVLRVFTGVAADAVGGVLLLVERQLVGCGTQEVDVEFAG